MEKLVSGIGDKVGIRLKIKDQNKKQNFWEYIFKVLKEDILRVLEFSMGIPLRESLKTRKTIGQNKKEDFGEYFLKIRRGHFEDFKVFHGKLPLRKSSVDG